MSRLILLVVKLFIPFQRYPQSAITYGSEAAYGSYQSLKTSKRCSSVDSLTYESDYGETFILLPPVDGGSTTNVVVSCSLTRCLSNQYLSNDECVQCPNNGRSAPGSTSIGDCQECPGGTVLPHPRSMQCALTDNYEQIVSATKWRLWAPDFHTVRGWVWDLLEIEFFGNVDCTGSAIDTSLGTAIDSGNAGGNSWKASNAFDGSMWSAWGGRYDSDNIFYIGMDFGNTLQTVRCVKLHTGDTTNKVVNVRVQAYSGGKWRNAWIEENLSQDTTYNIISLNYQTSTPTTAPVSTPSSTSCEDSPFRFQVVLNGNTRMRGCAWVAKRKTEVRCQLEGVKEHCPSTCDVCDNCVDSIARFRFAYNGRSMKRYCTWVARATASRCMINGMDDTCRSTCGNC